MFLLFLNLSSFFNLFLLNFLFCSFLISFHFILLIIMSHMHINFLEPDHDMQDELDRAKVEISRRGLELTSTTGFRKMVKSYFYRKYINQEVAGLDADVFLFFMSEGYNDLRVILGDEEVHALDRVSVMEKPWRRRDIQCVSVETLEVIDFFLGLNVSIC